MKWLVAALLAIPAQAVSLTVIVGEPDQRSALLWVEHDQSGTLTVTLNDDRRFGFDLVKGRPRQVALRDLSAGTRYRYEVSMAGDVVAGTFATAPAPETQAAFRFAFGGDVSGQNVCRDATLGLPIFSHLIKAQPDFWIGLGDMIYADNECEPAGRYGNAQQPLKLGDVDTEDEFVQRWRYNRADQAHAAALRTGGYFGVWDDHEAINDFSPQSAGPRLMPARQAFLSQVPMRNPEQMFRRVRWGRHAELFFLDTRSYRDANTMADGPDKTLLGLAQRDWLIQGLRQSAATWKFVVSSVPIAIPTGWPPENGRDGWASGGGEDGFEHELQIILDAIDDCVRNLVWLTTDVHHATAFRYQPTGASSFSMIELVTGPLHAGVFPGFGLDDTFGPTRLHYHAPESAEAIESLATAMHYFNFGLLDIDWNAQLNYQVINAYGEVVADAAFSPVAATCQSR